MQETWVRSLGWEDPLEKEMATHSNTLAWKIPWTEECGSLQSMELQSRTWLSEFTFFFMGGNSVFCQINKSLLVAQCEASNCLMVYSFIKIRKGCPSCLWWNYCLVGEISLGNCPGREWWKGMTADPGLFCSQKPREMPSWPYTQSYPIFSGKDLTSSISVLLYRRLCSIWEMFLTSKDLPWLLRL